MPIFLLIPWGFKALRGTLIRLCTVTYIPDTVVNKRPCALPEFCIRMCIEYLYYSSIRLGRALCQRKGSDAVQFASEDAFSRNISRDLLLKWLV